MITKRVKHLLLRYFAARANRRPYVLNIEVTHRCNARCEHCVCWRVDPGEELSDYVDIVKEFRPIIVWFTGGEPLLRKDLVEIIKNIRAQDSDLYLGMATNGWFLTPQLGQQLVKSGLDQVNISLDFIGHRHDEFRKIDGLYNHIETIVPELRRAGLNVVLACCILKENLQYILPIAQLAETWGIEVGYSCYSHLKIGDQSKVVSKEYIYQLQQIVDILCAWKKIKGTIKSSYSYLRKIPKFYEKGTIGSCSATKTWLYVSPDGHLKICPDRDVYSYYKDYSGGLKINCGKCWYTCRGEMETPFFERLVWELRHL